MLSMYIYAFKGRKLTQPLTWYWQLAGNAGVFDSVSFIAPVPRPDTLACCARFGLQNEVLRYV